MPILDPTNKELKKMEVVIINDLGILYLFPNAVNAISDYTMFRVLIRK